MLLVILGAGASFDSLPPDIRDQLTIRQLAEYRPPLAKELFDARDSFGVVLDKYPECAALVGELRSRVAGGASIEEELEQLMTRAEKHPLLHRGLVALRFYLQETLWSCGTTWREFSHGITNYATFFLRLDEWRHQQDEQVCIVNFNYDLLVDDALHATLGVDLSSVEMFVADPRYKYLKLHGSSNWGRRVHAPGGTYYSKPDHARRILIEHAETLNISEDFVLRDPDQPPSDSAPYPSILLPAIAIPVTSKYAFECPGSQLKALDRAIQETMNILVVGWRGSERHFLERLTNLPGMAPKVQIVGASEAGTQETADNLASVGLDQSVMDRFTDGFSAYLEGNTFSEFLDATYR
jgi:hypothetical protein